MYFDGSGKHDDPRAKHATLLGLAAEEDTWAYFENAWQQILSERGNPGYFHMADAMAKDEKRAKDSPFRGWPEQKIDFLVQGLIGVLRSMLRFRFKAFRCSVEITPYKLWKPILKLDEIPRLSAKWMFRHMYTWYGDFPNTVLSKIDVFFDRNEEFLKHIYRDWTDRRIRRKQPWWSLVNTVAPANSQLTPPLQGADMLAWSHNRLLSGPPDQRIDAIARDVVESPPCLHLVIDEQAIRKTQGSIVLPEDLRPLIHIPRVLLKSGIMKP
jgi:hypothetical protein